MPWTKPYHPPANRRLDPELYSTASSVCFVTIHADRKKAPFVREDLNRIIINALRAEQGRQDCLVYTYCLMPDHLHFLVSPCHDGVSVLTFVHEFKGKSTNQSWEAGWQKRLWQPRFYDHIVRREEDLRAIAQYILDNPVRRELIGKAEDWPWGGEMNPLPL